MNSGLILKDDTEKDCQLVFLGDEISICSPNTNQEIINLIKEMKPKVLAVDVGTEVPREELNQNEEQRKDTSLHRPHTSRSEPEGWKR